ncbi:PRD domain-containing protein [Heyndrickxia acidiproducens]|uniref:BglG family transcription antiterminator n=1 Tax=Heyndrickxia acidiproducens TaxID=1121084 RepID=UPI0003829662
MSLNSYNLAIQGKPNKGMYLSGTELDLRFFILDNLYDFLYSANHLDKEIEDAIIKIANHYDLESSTKKKLMQFIVVMLDRISKNKFLSVMKDKYMKLLETREYQVALEISTVIEKYFSIKIPEFEVLFMTIPIAGRRTPTNNKMMVDISISEDMIQLVHRIVEQIGFNENIIRENQAFFTDLQYHLTLMLNRLMFNLRLKNPLLSDVKEKYPVAYKMAEIAGDVIEKEYHLKVPKDELGYIAFYFGVLNSKNEIKTKRLQRVAVVCGTGRGTSELVAIQLQRILRQNTKIDVFSENDITKETLAPYDIVFSTVDIDFQTDSPLIRISEIFDENSILQKIEEVTFLHKFKIKSKGNSHFIIKVLANSDKFFVLDDKKSYQKNVDDMIDAMINRGYLDEGFKERIIERARKGSMVFDRYIAMPHTINHQSDQVVLAVGVFPNEIQEEGKEIKLVFLLGLPEQTNGDASMLVKIYDEILQIAKDENLIHQLSRSNSYQDFAASLDQPTR